MSELEDLRAKVIALAGEVERLGKDLTHDRHQWNLAVSDAEEARAEVAALRKALEWYASNGKQLFYCDDGSKLRADFSSRAVDTLAALADKPLSGPTP